jgi:hypothetical protein
MNKRKPTMLLGLKNIDFFSKMIYTKIGKFIGRGNELSSI